MPHLRSLEVRIKGGRDASDQKPRIVHHGEARAIQRYDALGKHSPYWLDSLFESSWAFFNQRKYEKAMGNLFTLSTPFFEITPVR